jgi:hypothetical protein
VLLRLFYLNDLLLAPNLVQSLFSVRCFTIDNSCSMEFHLFGLSVKDLATRCVLARYDNTGSLYTLSLPTSTTLTLCAVLYILATTASSVIIKALATPAPMSSLSYRVAQLSSAFGAEMIPCVMPAILIGTFGCPFLAPLPEPFSPLTLYNVTFAPPLFQVSLVTSINWSSSMTAPTTRGLFRCARSLTPSPLSPTSSPLCPCSLATPSRASSAIMDSSLITPPPAISSSLTTSSFGCRVPTLLRRMARPSA